MVSQLSSWKDWAILLSSLKKHCEINGKNHPRVSASALNCLFRKVFSDGPSEPHFLRSGFFSKRRSCYDFVQKLRKPRKNGGYVTESDYKFKALASTFNTISIGKLNKNSPLSFRTKVNCSKYY